MVSVCDRQTLLRVRPQIGVLTAGCRPYPATEVYVTGTFDDWGKTVQLDRVGDIFVKEVSLPATSDKIQYKVSTIRVQAYNAAP